MTDQLSTAAKPPLPRHPRTCGRLRFWVEMAREGDVWAVTAMIDGLDMGIKFDIEFTRWPNVAELGARIDAEIAGWVATDLTEINRALADKAREEQQSKEFWATRGARGHQTPTTT